MKCGFDKFIITSSAMVMFLGMFYLRLRVDRGSASAKDLQIAMQRAMSFGLVSPVDSWNTPSWMNIVGTAAISFTSSLSWFRAMSGMFASTCRIRQNRDQLLLFSYLSSSSVEYLSASERSSLLKLFEPVADEQEDLLFAPLVLKAVRTVEEVKAWWALRRYIQIDFQDESAIMDACGCIVFLLILGFLFCGVVEWSLHGEIFSPAFLLICTLSAVLTMAILRVFEVCIEINSILDRDSLLLTDAMLEAASLSDDQRPKVMAALQAIERRLTVTANLRNGWLVSLLVAFFSWGSRYMAPALS